MRVLIPAGTRRVALKMVEREVHHRKCVVLPAGANQRSVDEIREVSTIGQTGQRIVHNIERRVGA